MYAVIELIQRSRATSSVHEKPPTVNTVYESTSSDIESQPVTCNRPEISLFTLACMYLPYSVLRYAFHILSYLTFVSILVSYALAGPQAIWQLLSRPSVSLTPPPAVFFLYSVIGILAVVFFVEALLPFFSSLTVVKGGLFVAVVILVMYLPPGAHIMTFGELLLEPPAYSSVAVGFLMGTIALGGLAITTPVTYRLLPSNPSAGQLKRYRNAVLAGLFTCYVLNIGWVIAILQVVPRDDGTSASLKHAFAEGKITTVPLIESLRGKTLVSPQLLHSVEIIVQLFIIISTIVSFFVMAAGCKNYMDGFSESVQHGLISNGWVNEVALRAKSWLIDACAYLVAFVPIVALVMANPKGFITMLTRLTGAVINLQTGFMLFVMLYFCRVSRTSENDNQEDSGISSSVPDSEQPKQAQSSQDDVDETKIALPLSNWTVWAFIILGSLFFAMASFLAAFGPLFGVQLSAASG